MSARGGERVRFTVRCPVDGAVEVAADDVTTVVVRSGSDVEVAFKCPVCGRPITVRAQVPPSLAGLLGAAWGDPQSVHTESWVARTGCVGRCADPPPPLAPCERIDAYMEYFRRELDGADTVESMLSFMDAGTGR